jgi:hypothetical protein
VADDYIHMTADDKRFFFFTSDPKKGNQTKIVGRFKSSFVNECHLPQMKLVSQGRINSSAADEFQN